MKAIHSGVKRRTSGPHLRVQRRPHTAPTFGLRGTHLQVQRLVHELEVNQVELELQNEELRGARAALEACAKRYTELFDFAPIGYVTLDVHWRLSVLNHAAARLLGNARGHLSGRALSGLVAEADVTRLEQALACARSTRAQQQVDLMLQTGTAVSMLASVLDGGQILVAFQEHRQTETPAVCEDG